jgi:Ring finger domain
MTDTASALRMITCMECGREVPENNLTIHRAHACRGRARSSNTSREEAGATVDLTTNTPTPPRQTKRGRLKRDEDDYQSETDNENDDPMDVDDEVEDDDGSVEVIEKKKDNVIEITDDDEEWACDRCTLLNDKDKTMCAMCGVNRHGGGAATGASSTAFSSSQSDGVRPPDPVRRERLVGGEEINSSQLGDSPLGVVGGGALLGGVIGAMASWSRGRPISSGALQGSVAGAVSGVFLNELSRGSPTRHVHTGRPRYSGPLFDNDMATARSASVTGQPSYPSMGTTGSRHSTRQPRPSFRVTETINPDGSTRVIVSESSRSGSYVHQIGGPDQRLLNFLLSSPLSRAHLMGSGTGDIDNMSYDQLLAMYGNGSENLGASARLISTLPTAKITTKTDGTIDLPGVARECSVCLEDFNEGDIRKTLPCLHGFHDKCIDKWLHTNACCPVCKFRVEENRGSI